MSIAPAQRSDQPPDLALAPLVSMFRAARPVTVLTGAGCSTASGIPDYRGPDGQWKRAEPIQYQAFVQNDSARRRYWSRSMLGWPMLSDARPNRTHHCLAALQQAGWVESLITQNVDGLHQKAGSHDVLELHGGIDQVECLSCGEHRERSELQSTLERMNPHWLDRPGDIAPDGDVDLDERKLDDFTVPGCPRCRGLLKPAVVFFGESVPRERVRRATEQVGGGRALLAVGSSLMVFSGYRFVRQARRDATPVGIINKGTTRADDDAELKVDFDCGEVLARLAETLL